MGGAASVQAATVPSGFSTWPQQTTTDTHKVWTAKFSASVELNTVNSSNIYVTDDSDKLVKTTLTRSSDGVSVQVSPVNAYIAGKTYWLFMTKGLTVDGGTKQLTQPVAMPFIVGNINSVTNSFSSLITSFTVVTSPEVWSVKINGNEMQYQGNNIYTRGVNGLKQGAKVTVYAYDSSGKLLQSQSYTVK